MIQQVWKRYCEAEIWGKCEGISVGGFSEVECIVIIPWYGVVVESVVECSCGAHHRSWH